uniref:Ferric aerobactin receptor Cloacin receptor; Flags: n=1 Tax=Erwinia amylovora ATCC BAA-2158 TaxID=889211 RepID=E5B8S7_ERWAM|nr:Ferric aerobactin receptor Cloacin receptor; Flags: Precursor [Erwinia amylovora ATCC BAA-2158]
MTAKVTKSLSIIPKPACSSDRLDLMGTGTLNIDNHQQLQLTTQYCMSVSDGSTVFSSAKTSRQ